LVYISHACEKKSPRRPNLEGLDRRSERWRDKASGETLESYTIVTTDPNELISRERTYDRMSVILSPADYGRWLDPGDPARPPIVLPRPFPAEKMTYWQVGKDVGNVKNDRSDLIDPVLRGGAFCPMKAQSLKSRDIAGKPGEARQKRAMTAEALSFEPVYADGCTLAPTISMARTMRFKQLGNAKGKQPTGTTVDASCGNPLCFAAEHVMLRRSKSFGGKWSPLATKLARLPVGGSLDLPDYPSDEASRNRLRGGVGASAAGRMVRFSTQSLPTGGIRITRTGTWEAGEH
jgi:hypothetical protein